MMQAIKRAGSAPLAYSLEPRLAEHSRPAEPDHRRSLSPTAIGFLIPLFLVFLIGPFLCVFFVRRRRRTHRSPAQRVKAPKKPAESKEEARKRLEDVTEVSRVATGSISKHECSAEQYENANSTETISMMEKECAICLSTLFAPSPPEPAKIIETDNTASSCPPSVSKLSLSEKEAEDEEILRLKVCGHEFHAECLVSWCQIRKYSCPICRAAYYVLEAEKTEESEREMEEGRVTRDDDEAIARREGSPIIDEAEGSTTNRGPAAR